MLNVLPFLFFGFCILMLLWVSDGLRHGWSDEKISAVTALIVIACILYTIAGACHFEVLI